MKTLSCFIVDDDPLAVSLLRLYVEGTQGLSCVGAETSPLKALQLIGSGFVKPDITFVDIEMEELSGLELAEKIKEETLIIFCTAHPEYAAEAFDIGSIDYLLKPVTQGRFLKAIQRARREGAGEHEYTDYFTAQANGKGNIVKVYYRDIYYVEAKLNYVHVFTGKDEFKIYKPLKHMESVLPSSVFIKTHRSFIVNIQHFKSLSGYQIVLDDDRQVMISDTYRKDVVKFLNTKPL